MEQELGELGLLGVGELAGVGHAFDTLFGLCFSIFNLKEIINHKSIRNSNHKPIFINQLFSSFLY